MFHQNFEDYHIKSIKQFAKVPNHSENDASVTLCSGTQQIKVKAVLLRNVSNFLREIVPSPGSCSCNEPLIILPHSPSPALTSFVKLIHYGHLSRVSNVVAGAVTDIARFLGVENINMTQKEGSDDDNVDEESDISQSSIKVNTILEFSNESVILNFPKCRLERRANPNPTKFFKSDTFKGRIQKEYNSHPVGQYMGPYDQNEEINLSAQLPHSNFDFEKYTQFFHDGNKCFEYKIESYEKYDDLKKISSYKITSEIENAEKR